jgi:hypothetical protein
MKWSILWGWRVNARRGREPELPVFDDSLETWRQPGEVGPEAREAAEEEETGVAVR